MSIEIDVKKATPNKLEACFYCGDICSPEVLQEVGTKRVFCEERCVLKQWQEDKIEKLTKQRKIKSVSGIEEE